MRTSWVWTLLLLIALVAGSATLYALLRPGSIPEGLLYGNGQVEGTEVAVSAEITAKVIESSMVEGQMVKAGDVLVRLADADPRALLAQAEAELAALQRERDGVEDELRSVRHHLETAQADVERYRELRARGAAPPQRLEQVQNIAEETRGRADALAAHIGVAADRIEALQQQVNLARSQAEKATIRAPVSGTLLVKGIEPGELAMPGRLIAVLVDLSRLELRVFVPERDIGKVKLGDLALVRVDAFPDHRFAATVARVDQQAQFTPRDVHMPDERIRMVFGVTLALSNPERHLKPGMPADAWILWKPSVAWPNRLPVPAG